MVTRTAVDQAMVHHQAIMDTHQTAMGTVDHRMDMARDLMGMEETRMVVDQAMATGNKAMDTVVQVQVMPTDKLLKEDTVDQDIIMEGIRIGMEDIVIWKKKKKPRRMVQKTDRMPLLKVLEAWRRQMRRREMSLLKLKVLRSRHMSRLLDVSLHVFEREFVFCNWRCSLFNDSERTFHHISWL